MTNSELIVACRTQDRKAQQMLFDRFSPKMMGVCRRYLKTQEDAEDVLIEAFYKVFNNLPQFKAQGSFEGWIRRIVVNECLMFLRRRHNFNLTVEIDQNLDVKTTLTTQDQLEADDILALLERLPTGYRTVFNLYVLEGYKHREIGEILGISINTSKSQLILAKKKLQQLLMQINYPGVNQEGAG